MKHNFIISIYKKSEMNLINFHLTSLAKYKFENELIFNLIINPELFEYAKKTIENQNNIKITIIKGISSFLLLMMKDHTIILQTYFWFGFH